MVSTSNDEYSVSALYADYLNRGYKLRDLSEFTKVSPSTLTNRLKKFFSKGLLKVYYNVIFQKLPIKVRFIAVSFNHRQRIDKCIGNKLDLITGFYTPTPTLTYFIYVNQRFGEEIEFNTGRCRVVLDEEICSSLIPIENYVGKKIELHKPDETRQTMDEQDLEIVREIFHYFNPPPFGNLSYIKLIKGLNNPSGFRRKKIHFYKHVLNKLVVKRILYREPSSYSIIIIYSNGLKETTYLLNNLVAKGFLKGVDQVNVISFNPFIAVVHCWINEELLWDTNYVDEWKDHYRYEVYLVKRIKMNGSG